MRGIVKVNTSEEGDGCNDCAGKVVTIRCSEAWVVWGVGGGVVGVGSIVARMRVGGDMRIAGPILGGSVSKLNTDASANPPASRNPMQSQGLRRFRDTGRV